MKGTEFPPFVQKYFWGDDLNDLNLEKHEQYITQTILDIGDDKSVKWLFSVIDPQKVKQKLSEYKLSSLSRNYWNTIFHVAA